MKPRIAVVGSINMDLVFRTRHMPRAGETVQGHEVHQIPGGKGANQAVAAARMGAEVAFIGCVGDDAFGTRLREVMDESGLDTRHLLVAPNAASGVAAIFLSEAGENSIVLAPGANHVLSPGHVMQAANAIVCAKLLICQLETPLDTIWQAVETARQSRVPVILNAAPVQSLSDKLLAQVDYLVVNETEASRLGGLEVMDHDTALMAARMLLRRGAGTVLLTMGGQGVLVAEGDAAPRFIPAFPVHVVDTTAAGDTFVGAFAVALAEGRRPFDAAMEAQYAAALAVTRLGAQTSIPFKADVDSFKKRIQR